MPASYSTPAARRILVPDASASVATASRSAVLPMPGSPAITSAPPETEACPTNERTTSRSCCRPMGPAGEAVPKPVMTITSPPSSRDEHPEPAEHDKDRGGKAHGGHRGPHRG